MIVGRHSLAALVAAFFASLLWLGVPAIAIGAPTERLVHVAAGPVSSPVSSPVSGPVSGHRAGHPATTGALADSRAVVDVAPRVWFHVGDYQVRDDDLWIVCTGILCSVACGILGCFLVLRRMSLLGDAISHAILPGLALAFIVTGSREPLAMLAGAMIVGIATAFISTALHRWGKVPEDAALGVVFSTLFALGVILITLVARSVDLDPGCVLYGLIEFTPFDTVRLLGFDIPRAFAWLALVLTINAALIFVFFKELKIVCFDPYLATTMGISAVAVHYALMTSVAATAVASFESVGSILVIAMLVAPGATAHLLTDKLSRMIWTAALVAAASAILGYVLAVWINTSVAGMIATVALALFMLAALFSPHYGVIAKVVRRLILAMRITQEDALGMLYRWHEQSPELAPITRAPGSLNRPVPLRPLSVQDVVDGTRSGLMGRVSIWWLARQGMLSSDPAGSLTATALGLKRAGKIVRGHRLWESYLAKHLGLPLDHVHSGAHRAEHFLSDELQDQLQSSESADTDPHGRPIPSKQ